jgi:DNA-binding NtrC family response regulator
MKSEFDGVVERLLAGNIFLQEAVEVLEKNMIEVALRLAEGNQCAASKRLGIHRNTLQRKMREYGLANGRRARARRKPVVRETPARKSRKGVA